MKLKSNLKKLILLVICLQIVFFGFNIFPKKAKAKTTREIVFKQKSIPLKEIKPTIQIIKEPIAPMLTAIPTPKPTTKPKPTKKPTPTPKRVTPQPYASRSKSFKTVVGKVSFYSKSGCIGCSKKQVTASGEIFDENAMTFAIPYQWRKEIPMGTKAKVTNLDNGLSSFARVNDTGGFLKYNRVADLSKGLMNKIGAKTDRSNIKIEFFHD